mmetsp:Transcript_31671/g.51451  ORF Transcript_31671/g.51451 Transcript_31671/m.51451 type:complete len:227 (-) Transcript_31671:675-1355(-)
MSLTAAMRDFASTFCTPVHGVMQVEKEYSDSFVVSLFMASLLVRKASRTLRSCCTAFIALASTPRLRDVSHTIPTLLATVPSLSGNIPRDIISRPSGRSRIEKYVSSSSSLEVLLLLSPLLLLLLLLLPVGNDPSARRWTFTSSLLPIRNGIATPMRASGPGFFTWHASLPKLSCFRWRRVAEPSKAYIRSPLRAVEFWLSEGVEEADDDGAATTLTLTVSARPAQ